MVLLPTLAGRRSFPPPSGNKWVGPSLTSSHPGATAVPCSPSPQDQLKQLQEILGSLSLQEEKSRVSQQRLDQQLNSEAQQSSSLVAQLQAMVAEREAKVRQLEMEIGQLSMQVSGVLAPPDTDFSL